MNEKRFKKKMKEKKRGKDMLLGHSPSNTTSTPSPISADER